MSDREQFPCGCVTSVEGDTFVLEACALGRECEVVRYVLAETERQAKPFTVLDMP